MDCLVIDEKIANQIVSSVFRSRQNSIPVAIEGGSGLDIIHKLIMDRVLEFNGLLRPNASIRNGLE